MMKPLADLVQRELDVMRAARRALLQIHSKQIIQYERVVIGMLELRSTLNAWNEVEAGEVRYLPIIKAERL